MNLKPGWPWVGGRGTPGSSTPGQHISAAFLLPARADVLGEPRALRASLGCRCQKPDHLQSTKTLFNLFPIDFPIKFLQGDSLPGRAGIYSCQQPECCRQRRDGCASTAPARPSLGAPGGSAFGLNLDEINRHPQHGSLQRSVSSHLKTLGEKMERQSQAQESRRLVKAVTKCHSQAVHTSCFMLTCTGTG